MKNIFSDLEPLIKDDETSKQRFKEIAEREQQNQIQQERKMRGRARMVAIIIAFSSLISIVFFVYDVTQKIQLENIKEQVEQKSNTNED